MIGTLSELKGKVEEYCTRYRHPEMAEFNSGPLYDLFPEKENGALIAEHRWSDTWPSNGKAGIYTFIDGEGRVVYIGKSSMKSSVSARLNSYCKYGPGKICRLIGNWKVQPRYVWIIGVPAETAFEAAALEEFLIREITTSDNKNGILVVR
ncbi:hypothetical protein [Saccharospirillum sp.]|uniref:hypothetical protein n=1 Tax=Saccharospirillum sp. TaxID=2033801 RepID=UPI0034A09DDB